jgi:hypothetical protein
VSPACDRDGDHDVLPGIGGAAGAAVLGAIFTAQAGTTTTAGSRHLSAGVRADVIHRVQAVFLTAAPIAAIALIVVLALREAPLQGSAREPAGAGAPAPGR